MTDAPERIWLTDAEVYGRGRPPEQWANPEKGALATPYIRLDLHEAAVAAARAEGMREAAAQADRASAIYGERQSQSNAKESRDWQSMKFAAVDIAAAIRAEASK